MKRIILVFSLLLAAGSAQALPPSDRVSEATVAASAYDSREDCKCLGNKKSILPASNPRNDLRVVEWAVDPNAKGNPPALGTAETAE